MTPGILMRAVNDALDTMKNSLYSIVPIHERPDLFKECCRIINAEWPASETRRLKTLSESCEEFPTCLVLLNKETVIGHCKLSRIPNELQCCFLGSVVIDHPWRSKGLGTMLLRGAEEYAAKKGIIKIYLSTKGQEGFYSKNGYSCCPPVNLWYMSVPAACTPIALNNIQKSDRKTFTGPPPPPMPVQATTSSSFTSSKTYMVKIL